MRKIIFLGPIGLASLTGYGQSNLKKYTGDYPSISFARGDATATYTYKDNPNGGRIYEGPFQLVWGYSNPYFLKGNFKDNKQDGEWQSKWEINPNSSLTVNFKDGVLDGPVAYQDDEVGITVNCNFSNGKLHGPFKSKRNAYGSVMMEGSFDQNIPSGVWTKTDGPNKVIYDFKRNGQSLVVTTKEEDLRTGDLTQHITTLTLPDHLTAYDLPSGFEVISDLLQVTSEMVIRDSKKRSDSYLEISIPSDQSDDNFKAVREMVVVRDQPEERQTKPVPEKIFGPVEQLAEFPGGAAAMMKWISENLRYPEEAQQNGITGRVVIKFVIEKDGSISNPQVVKGVVPSLDKEACRLVRQMPKWIPGKNNGQAVRSYYNLPVTFRLKE